MVDRADGRTRPTRAETRRRVLDAAYAVFAEHGIGSSSLADVATSAGLTKGAIYSSFAGKDELVLALMEERVLDRLSSATAGFTPSASRAPADAGETPVADRALETAGRLLLEAMRTDPAAHRLLMEYFATSHRDPARREALRRARRRARDAIAAALERLRDEGGLTLAFPPDDTAVLVLALSNGLALESGIDPDAVPDDLLGRVFAVFSRPDR